MLRKILCIIIGLLFGGASAWAREATYVTALVVGANRSFNAHLPQLEFADSDAKQFAAAMEAVGTVTADRLITLENPSVEDYKAATRRIASLVANSPAGSNVNHKLVFYFSGHADEDGLHLRDGMIPKADLHSFLSSVSAGTKVVILDSCFSGALSQKGATKAAPFEIPQAEYDEPTGTIFLTASSAQEGAFESKALKGGIFTHHLLNGIYGQADINRDGIVTVDELYQYVYRETRLQGIRSPQALTQRPEFVSQLQGRGAVAVAFPARPDGGIRLSADLPSALTITSSEGIQYFSVQKPVGEEKSIQLPAGDYKLSANDGDRYGQTAVRVAAKTFATLNRDSLTWSKVAPSTRDATKGEDKKSVTASLGMHGAFSPFQSQGPAGSLELALPLLAANTGILRALAAVSYYRSTLRNHDATGQNDSHSGTVGFEVSRVLAFNDYAPSAGLVFQAGQNYQREVWNYPDSPKATFTAWSPCASVMARFEIFLPEFGIVAAVGKEALRVQTTENGRPFLTSWLGTFGLEKSLP